MSRNQRKEALNKLKLAKAGKTSRIDQYKVNESNDLILQVDEAEYEKMVEQRRKEKFIVDDMGLGYDDEGEFDIENNSEEYEEAQPEEKEEKPTSQSITNFIKPDVKKPRLISTSTKEEKESRRKNFLSMLDDDEFDKEKLLKPIIEPKNKATLRKGESADAFKKNYDIPIAALKKNVPEKVAPSALASGVESLKRPAPGLNTYEHVEDYHDYEIEASHPPATSYTPKPAQASHPPGPGPMPPMPFSASSSKKSLPQETANQGSSFTRPTQSNPSQPLPPKPSSHPLPSSSLPSSSLQKPLPPAPIPDPMPETSMDLDDQFNPEIKIEEEFQEMEIETATIETLAIENNPEIPIKNGSLQMFWIDAIEDKELMPGKVFLFGKVFLPNLGRYTGACVLISDVKRRFYALPKDEFAENFEEIHKELDGFRKKYGIRKWAMEFKEMKYAFEIPGIPAQARYIEVEYSSMYPAFSQSNFRTVKHVFNGMCSLVENLMVHRRLKGPCWVEIKNPSQPKNKISNCRIELVVNSYEDVEVELLGINNPPPPLSMLCLSIKTSPNKKGENEIYSIGFKVHQKVELTTATEDIPSYMANYSILNTGKEEKISNSFETVRNEKRLLERFLERVSLIDPDFLIAHDLFSDISDKLLTRILALRPDKISQLGRIFRSKPPNLRKDQLYTGNWQFRGLTAGRLLLDTQVSSKELSREKNYNLKELSKNWFQFELTEVDFDLPEIQKDANLARKLVKIVQDECQMVYSIIKHLNIIPLSKELTNIAGNLWLRSLQNQRAERNEMLLIHEFHRLGFIYPDRPEIKYEEKSDKKKNQYSGGKVLDPVSGLYDKYVILLDFNSLYPSIIREYNICFTTVARPKTLEAKDNNDPGTVQEDAAPGVLPDIITHLVNQRRQVKNVMKNESNKSRYKQLDIKQTALKLTANSMYGCLGFKASRFYARAIAALITQIGRNTLERTVKLAKDSLSLEVIYGDTDSIMIHTGLDDIQAAIKKGEELKYLVNKQFKKLEIELDGVFRSMLLLKKKKYAALKVENGQLKREVKGLDMVRRDWCDLSRKLSEQVLDIILSDQAKDEISDKIRTCVEEFYNSFDSRVLSEFIITKQLTKTVDKYKDAYNQPHVQVAIRLQTKQNKSLFKHFIPYVICEGEQSSIASRAYHPEELTSANGTLSIDKKWYITQQIIPPLSRLIEPITLIKLEEIVKILGEDPAKYRQQVVVKKIPLHSKENIKCKCNNPEHEEFDLAMNDDSINCPKCPFASFPQNYASNAMVMFMKKKMMSVYKSEFRCTNLFNCARTSKVRRIRDCGKNGCQGKILPFPQIGELNVELDRCVKLSKKYWTKGHQVLENTYRQSGYKTVDLSAVMINKPNYQRLLI